LVAQKDKTAHEGIL